MEKREKRRESGRTSMTAALREAPPPAAPPAASGDSYSARHLTVLEGLDAVRKRPGMYIGSSDGRGMQHCLWGIIDNSVDEALHSTCSKIEGALHPDHSAEGHNNRRGLPVDLEPDTRLDHNQLLKYTMR